MNSNENEEKVLEGQSTLTQTESKKITIEEENVHKKNSSKLGIFLLVIGIILIGTGIGFSFMDKNKKPQNKPIENNKDKTSDFEIEIQTEYTGILMYDTKKKISDIFDITIPAEFIDIDKESNSINKKYETIEDRIYNSCVFKLDEVINFKDAKKLSNSMARYYKSEESLTTKEINNIEWYNLQYESTGKVDAYIAQKENTIYMMTYTIEDNANETICNQYKDTILNSVAYK